MALKTISLALLFIILHIFTHKKIQSELLVNLAVIPRISAVEKLVRTHVFVTKRLIVDTRVYNRLIVDTQLINGFPLYSENVFIAFFIMLLALTGIPFHIEFIPRTCHFAYSNITKTHDDSKEGVHVFVFSATVRKQMNIILDNLL
ncbi:hypothetical protein GQR58_001020 [Nymphon striatum]|nr:hypothetical protein GQR58_001020 [Nymphon striatum]